MSPEERLTELRTRAAELEKRKLTKEAQADQADAHHQQAMTKLATEFQVSSVEEGQALLHQMEARLGLMLNDIERALHE